MINCYCQVLASAHINNSNSHVLNIKSVQKDVHNDIQVVCACAKHSSNKHIDIYSQYVIYFLPAKIKILLELAHTHIIKGHHHLCWVI